MRSIDFLPRIRLNLANVITSFRIVFAFALLLCPTISAEFYTLYLIGGATDILDGIAARALHQQSDFGSALDTTADIVFVFACTLSIFTFISLSVWLWLWICGIALVKILSGVLCGMFRRKLLLEHTLLNKYTGILLFVFPLVLEMVNVVIFAIVICSVATISAVQEMSLMIKGVEVK